MQPHLLAHVSALQMAVVAQVAALLPIQVQFPSPLGAQQSLASSLRVVTAVAASAAAITAVRVVSGKQLASRR